MHEEEESVVTDLHGNALLKCDEILDNRYQILAVIGVGGFSQIISAIDLTSPLQLQVAIKVMNANYPEIGQHEAKNLKILNSADQMGFTPVVRLLSTFWYHCHFCLVLELCGAMLLNLHPPPSMQKCKKGLGYCSLDQVRQIAIQLCAGLQLVRDQGIIHADLKPDNILYKQQNLQNTKHPLTSSKETGSIFPPLPIHLPSNSKYDCKVKIVDFGNCIAEQDIPLYLEDFEAQSLLYRAPEVALGVSLDYQIDIWSLGCILVELLLGKPLFVCHDRLSLVEEIEYILGDLPENVYYIGKFYDAFISYKMNRINDTSLHQQRKEHLKRFFQDDYDSSSQDASSRDASSRDATYKDSFLQSILSQRCDYTEDLGTFLEGLLHLDPGKRFTPIQALLHPFIGPYFPFSMVFSSHLNKPTLLGNKKLPRLSTWSNEEVLTSKWECVSSLSCKRICKFISFPRHSSKMEDKKPSSIKKEVLDSSPSLTTPVKNVPPRACRKLKLRDIQMIAESRRPKIPEYSSTLSNRLSALSEDHLPVNGDSAPKSRHNSETNSTPQFIFKYSQNHPPIRSPTVSRHPSPKVEIPVLVKSSSKPSSMHVLDDLPTPRKRDIAQHLVQCVLRSPPLRKKKRPYPSGEVKID